MRLQEKEATVFQCVFSGASMEYGQSLSAGRSGSDNSSVQGLHDTTVSYYDDYMDLIPPRSALLILIDGLYVYFVPVIIVIGLVTNGLSLCVFLSHLRLQSSSVYLAWLAFSDSMFLIMTSFSWLGWIRVMWVHNNGICQLVIYGSYVWAFTSVWIVVGFTVDRFIVVCHPLSRMSMCTRRRAKIVATSLNIAAAVLYSYVLWTSRVRKSGGIQYCDTDPNYRLFAKLMMYVDLVLTLVLPSTAILALNSRITWKIYKFLKNRPLDGSFQASSVSSLGRSSQNLSSDRRCRRPNMLSTWQGSPRCMGLRANPSSQGFPQMKTTRMLMVVSFVFIFLNVPSHGLRLYRIIAADLNLGLPSHTMQRIQEILEILYYINFSINFFLYSMCMKSFRQATKRVCCKACLSIRNAVLYIIRSVWTVCSCRTLITFQNNIEMVDYLTPESV